MGNNSVSDDGRVELPRDHDLAPRRWRLPSGEIIGEAVNREAIELLKRDPDEYFRRTGRFCTRCGGRFVGVHVCRRDQQ